MPNYFYKAKTRGGKLLSGEIEAKNEYDLANILRKEGSILISATPDKESKKRSINISLPFFGRVKIVDKLMLVRNLKVLISAGVSLPRAFKILSEQTKNKKLKKILLKIGDEIIKGRNFSDTLSEYPSVFSELFYNMVKVGEESGTLENVLGNLERQMEREHDLKSKVMGAMIYPAVIITAMVGIGILMLIVVVPRLAETFEELGVDLPFTTRMVVAFGIFLSNYWYLFLLTIIGFIFLIRFLLKTKSGKLAIDTILLKIPIISSVIKKTNSAHTARTLSSLISSGVPIVRSLEIISGALSNIYYKKAMLEAAEEMKKGTKLAECLKKYDKIYSSLIVQMVEIGEETGETSEILQKLADFYEEEVTNITKNMSSIIEPVLMLIIGAAVGFFAISMIQPMYSMLGAIE